ncbi:VWA domain-containing protein [Aquimonas sp.]|jgi:Ca-activated chloride channel family protein|uniref:VWA domain-containing protein n=1 Tax=Aquimonas sp. TaxID=1872588 RepID=UPI0037C089D2
MSLLGSLAEFHFLRPLWLLALGALPLMLLWRRRQQGAADPWRAVVDAALLALQTTGTQRVARLQEWLLVLGVGIGILALAGPAFRSEPMPLLKLQAPLIVALDLSPSVRAADLRPDRLSRARFKLADLIRRRSDGQTALLAFAGEAFTVAPLTDDASTLDSLLAALDPSIMPVPGHRPERALRMARRLLADAGAQRGDVLLLTDQASDAALEAAAEAFAAGLRVSVLGLGTPEGAPVAVGGGGFMRDSAGNIRLPRLDEPSLQALASAGGGRYARISSDASDLAALGFDRGPTEGGGLGTSRDEDAAGLRYRDEGPLLLVLLLPLAALAARRGWLLVFALVVLPPPPSAWAQQPVTPPDQTIPAPEPEHEPATPGAVVQFWNDLWQRRDRQAWDALQANEPSHAATLAKDAALRGSAAFRAGDFQAALGDFSAGDDARAHYNRGNALAKLQRYEDALAAYAEALQREPGHADAAANQKALRDWLQQQEQQKQKQDQSQDSQQQDGEQSGESGESGEPKEQDSEGAESEPADAQEGEPDQPSEEEQQGEGAESESASEPEPEPSSAEDPAEDQQDAFSQAMQEALQETEQPPEQQAQPIDAETMAESERQQAIEQLLRRVPDDPGGLLRRKFLLEYQRRQREGEQ